MGVLPGYATIGLVAPIILATLRFLQGVGLGGEWGGSVLLSMEYGDDERRCFWASWPQTGVPIGLALAALIVLLFQSLYPGSAFESIGWRIPFLLSTVLVILGLYIRLRILETPSFSKLKEEKHISKTPLLEVMRYHWRKILLCALLRSGETAPFYIFTTFMLSYTAQDVKLDIRLLYTGFALSAVVGFFAIPTFALISDRVGRKLWFALGTILMAAFVFPYFLLLQTKNPVLVVCAFVFSIGICESWLYGPEAALISEQFETRLRYSGASLGYQLASVTAGGPAPIVAIYLLLHYKTFGGGFAAGRPSYVLIAIFIIFMSLLSFISVLLLKEHRRS